jgi:hypothetical protein
VPAVADRARLGQPGAHPVVDVLRPVEPDAMHVVVGRHVLDPGDPLVADRPREQEVRAQVVAAGRIDAGEADAGLEGDPRAGRVDRDRPERPDGLQQGVEDGAQAGRRVREVLVEVAHRARVRHVARDERLPAVRAAP